MPSAEEFTKAGLYDPVLDADTGRLDLLGWLDQLGFTIEEIQRAHDVATDGVVGLAIDRRVVGGELLRRSEALELSGLVPAELDRAANAIGFLPISGSPEGEIGFTAADAAMFTELDLFTSMFSPDETVAALRVIGSSVARIAEALVSLFLQDIEAPHLSAGGSELDLAQQAYEAVGLFDSGFGVHLNSMLRRHTMQAIERTRYATIGFDERFEYRFAVGFVDLVGFTAMSAQMSPRELGTFVRDFEGRSYDAIVSADARVVKLIGDEVMFVSHDPNAACRAADALMSGFDSPGGHVRPRGGLAYGNVLLRGGDYYGSVGNLASRLVDEAVPQELLVTDELATAATDCRFEPAGRRMLKGFVDPVSVNSFLNC